MLTIVRLASRSGWSAAQVSPHGPPKSCTTRWAVAHSQRVEHTAEVPGVTVNRVHEALRLVGAAEAGHVRRDAARHDASARHQPLPVLLRARIAVDQDDGLPVVCRAGVQVRAADAVDGDRPLGDLGQPGELRGAHRTASPVSAASGLRGRGTVADPAATSGCGRVRAAVATTCGANSADGRASMPRTWTYASATCGSRVAAVTTRSR